MVWFWIAFSITGYTLVGAVTAKLLIDAMRHEHWELEDDLVLPIVSWCFWPIALPIVIAIYGIFVSGLSHWVSDTPGQRKQRKILNAGRKEAKANSKKAGKVSRLDKRSARKKLEAIDRELRE